MGAALLFLQGMVRGCGWLNAVLGGQPLTNAEEEEDEGELEDEDCFLCLWKPFSDRGLDCAAVIQIRFHWSNMRQIFLPRSTIYQCMCVGTKLNSWRLLSYSITCIANKAA